MLSWFRNLALTAGGEKKNKYKRQKCSKHAEALHVASACLEEKRTSMDRGLPRAPLEVILVLVAAVLLDHSFDISTIFALSKGPATTAGIFKHNVTVLISALTSGLGTGLSGNTRITWVRRAWSSWLRRRRCGLIFFILLSTGGQKKCCAYDECNERDLEHFAPP
jgi:hypothetical protein